MSSLSAQRYFAPRSRATASARTLAAKLIRKQAIAYLKRKGGIRGVAKAAHEKYEKYKGKSAAPPRPNVKGRRFIGTAYNGNKSFDTGQNMTKYKRPVKGNAGTRFGRVVVNKVTGQRKRQQTRRFGESTYQKYYIGSTPNMNATGDIGFLDKRYTNKSVDSKHLTGWVFNVGGTELNWDPTEYKIGNTTIAGGSTLGNNFYMLNAANTSVDAITHMYSINRIPETATPVNNGADHVPTLTYKIPNSILSTIDLNLSFTPISGQDNWLTVKVIRASTNEPIVPSYFTPDSTPAGQLEGEKQIFNDPKNTNGHLFQTLYSTTILLKGLMPNMNSYKTHYIRKKINLNLSRSTCRRTSSATESALLGEMLKPTFEIDSTGAMFNNVFVVATSKCVDDQLVRTAVSTLYTNVAGELTSSASHMYPQLATANDARHGVSQFRYGGTIGIKHYVRDISRGVSSHSSLLLASTLQKQIDALALHTHYVKKHGESSEPILDSDHSNHSETDEEPDMIPNPKKKN